MKETRARIFRGNTRSEGKLLSLFEPSTEVIRKGKAGKPNEFGKMVKLQEAENQIITDYEVYGRRPYDSDLLVGAIGRTKPCGDARRVWWQRMLHSIPPRMKPPPRPRVSNVKRVCIPNRSTKSPERNPSRESAGSATARNGAPDARDASASSSGDTASTAADTRAPSAWTAGSVSASSPTASSTSVAH
jgi:hypothetical protein